MCDQFKVHLSWCILASPATPMYANAVHKTNKSCNAGSSNSSKTKISRREGEKNPGCHTRSQRQGLQESLWGCMSLWDIQDTIQNVAQHNMQQSMLVFHLVKSLSGSRACRAKYSQLRWEENASVLQWGRVSSFTLPYIWETGPYGPPMSICTKVMSKGVHNIVFSVTPDTCTALQNSPESFTWPWWELRPLPRWTCTMYMLNMVIILIIMYSNVVTAIGKIYMYLLCFNTELVKGDPWTCIENTKKEKATLWWPGAGALWLDPILSGNRWGNVKMCSACKGCRDEWNPSGQE